MAAKRVCFYHAGCPDGFGAAWAVWRAWGEDAEYVARGHEDELVPERLAGRSVAFVDVSLPNPLLRALCKQAERVVLLDHHLSARDRFESEPDLRAAAEAGGHRVVFDLEHSGAVLAWRHFHPGEPVPRLLEYVEDQDIWRWELPLSEEVNAAIASYPRRFGVWDKLAARAVSELAEEGAPIARANRMEVERLLRTAHPITLGELRVEAINSPRLRSSLGHELSKRAAFGRPCGVVYRLVGSRVDVSIYSIGNFDASAVAGAYGGGGHRNAAGFTIPLRDWVESFVP